MKRLSALIFLAIFLAAYSSAQALSIEGYGPKDPESMAMGGAFLSISEGHLALFGNPAGLADAGSTFYLVSDAWMYIQPSFEAFQALSSAQSGNIAAMDRLMAVSGYGEGANMGLCLAGDGFGFSVLASFDAYMSGADAASASGSYSYTVQAALGYSATLDFFGLPLALGGDLRPYYYVEGAMDAAMAAGLLRGGDWGTVLSASPVIAGFGVTLDLGATLKAGDFVIGISVRDIAPPFAFGRGAMGELLDGYGKGELNLPSSTDRPTVTTPPFLTLGASYRPFAGADIDPRFLVELQDPIGVLARGESFIDMLHMGADCALFGVWTLRAGLDEGNFCFGTGFKLGFLSLDAAYFAESAGLGPGGALAPRQGISVELSLEF